MVFSFHKDEHETKTPEHLTQIKRTKGTWDWDAIWEFKWGSFFQSQNILIFRSQSTLTFSSTLLPLNCSYSSVYIYWARNCIIVGTIYSGMVSTLSLSFSKFCLLVVETRTLELLFFILMLKDLHRGASEKSASSIRMKYLQWSFDLGRFAGCFVFIFNICMNCTTVNRKAFTQKANAKCMKNSKS